MSAWKSRPTLSAGSPAPAASRGSGQRGSRGGAPSSAAPSSHGGRGQSNYKPAGAGGPSRGRDNKYTRGSRGSFPSSTRGRGGFGAAQSSESGFSYNRNYIQLASKAFSCPPADLIHFKDKQDPFNPKNTLSGFGCRQQGVHESSLFLTHVCNEELPEPVLVWGALPSRSLDHVNAETSFLSEGYRFRNDEEIAADDLKIDFRFPPLEAKGVSHCFLAKKWNGTSILFFKYPDTHGNTFITAKPRRAALVQDTEYGDQFSLCVEALGLPPVAKPTKAEAPAAASSSPVAASSSSSSSPDETTPTEAGVSTPLVLTHANLLEFVGGDINVEKLPALLHQLADPDTQSICFELCGSRIPHLIRYDFPLALKPLYLSATSDGLLRPVLPKDGGAGQLIPYTSTEELEALLRNTQSELFARNQAYRKQLGLKHLYWFNTFAEEGIIVYFLVGADRRRAPVKSTRAKKAGIAQDAAKKQVLNVANPFALLEAEAAAAAEDNDDDDDNDANDDAEAENNEESPEIEEEEEAADDEQSLGLARTLGFFKVKPPDFRYHHHAQFDNSVQFHVLETLHDIRQKIGGVSAPEEELKAVCESLDLSDDNLIRWKQEISKVISVPSRREADSNSTNPRVLVLVGAPGAGKSSVAQQLQAAGWVTANQDSLRTRRACEVTFTEALQAGKDVVVDRLNFDRLQRQTWITLAAEYKPRSLDCIFFNVQPELLKQRVAQRPDHPTIPSGSAGLHVVDKILRCLIPPHQFEGFDRVFTVTSTEEIDSVLSANYNVHFVVPVNEEASSAASAEETASTEA